MPFTREELLEEHKSCSELREHEDERKARLLAKVTLVQGGKTLISVILPAVAGVFALILSVVAYVEFLKIWKFAATDVVYIAMALALFFVFSKSELLEASGEKPSWLTLMIMVVLLVAWILSDWVIFAKKTRLSELIDALGGLILAGLYLGWAGKNYLRYHPPRLPR